jgi:hypothetical protein
VQSRQEAHSRINGRHPRDCTLEANSTQASPNLLSPERRKRSCGAHGSARRPSGLYRNHRQGRRETIFCCFDDKSMDHYFLNGPVRALDEKGRCGIGNDRQDPVRLRFNLYQGPNSPVLSGASYRGHAKPRRIYRQTSCQSARPQKARRASSMLDSTQTLYYVQSSRLRNLRLWDPFP